MGRPCTTGLGKKRKTYQRTAVEYSHKLDVLKYRDDGYSLDETIEHFYGSLSSSKVRAKKKQINKWIKQQSTIQDACDSGRGSHKNLRNLGDATVLPSEAEKELVLWINSLRKDGAPVSRTMLYLQAEEVAADCDLGDKFGGSDTWIKLFLRRHKLSLRARTRQGQTTPEDAEVAAKDLKALVLQTIVEKQCVQVYNADQTAVNFEYLPKQTIAERGSKTIWVKCANKDKTRATAMLLGDWEGAKYQPFLLYKTGLAKPAAKRAENDALRHGFGETQWKREIKAMQATNDCR